MVVSDTDIFKMSGVSQGRRTPVNRHKRVDSAKTTSMKEMRRFLPADLVTKTVESEDFWLFLIGLLNDLFVQMSRYLSGECKGQQFSM